MIDYRENLSTAVARVARADLRSMLRLVRALDRLSRDPAYRARVYGEVPRAAAFDPGHAAVMMCYDFHLTDAGPRLIEVNTNAGGGLLAYLARHPDRAASTMPLEPRLAQRLLQTFAEEFRQFSGGGGTKPGCIAIIDETPEQQYLYGEMRAFAELFGAWGVAVEIVDPCRLDASPAGVLLDGRPVDLIYNRHCDFYLESPAMAGVREAYLARRVCLTPNPHMYGLLADKRRMTLWADPAAMAEFDMDDVDRKLLARVVPATALLADLDRDLVWAERRRRVFKPVDSFGSRGVLIGEKISRKRFDELPSVTTLVQELVPPSLTDVPGDEPMKTDLRLFAYRGRVLGVAARLYRGQVTNLRTPGGGFAAVAVI